MTTSAGAPLETPLLTAEEIASVRRPFRAASLLPARAYHDEAIFEFERREWFGRDWMMVGRAEDVPTPGSYMLAEVDGEPLVIVRGRDDVVRAFFNVCRHRGTAVVEEQCGTAVRFQCPYHAWIYDLDGRLVRAKHTDDLADFAFEDFGLRPVRLDSWQGFLFASLAEEGPSLAEQLGDLDAHFARFDVASLRVAHSASYELDANWKFVAENYSECYHCPGLHPQLNRLTPYDLGADFDPNGEWQGGYMELAADAETMALAGGHRNGRPSMAGSTADDERRVTYYLVWPNIFLSIHPDYLLVHKLTPTAAGSHEDRLPVAVRAVDDRAAGLRPDRCDRVLGPHEPAGLARLRAPAPRHEVALVGGRALFQRRNRPSTRSTSCASTATPATASSRAARSASATTSRSPSNATTPRRRTSGCRGWRPDEARFAPGAGRPARMPATAPTPERPPRAPDRPCGANA